jgi:frataxin-like iron-binding protein CyaY
MIDPSTELAGRSLRYLSQYNPSSRRKPKDSDMNDNMNMLSHEKYALEVSHLFMKIRVGVEPLFQLNPGYSFADQQPEHSLVINVGVKGNYRIQADMKNQLVILHSPVSGVVQYTYDATEKQWLGISDRHDLRGLLTRDFIRHSVGLPNFD